MKDALIQYAARREVRLGDAARGPSHPRRPSGKPAIFGTAIEPRDAAPGHLAPAAGLQPPVGRGGARERVEARSKTPFVVYDRSVLQDVRGIMNLALQNDPILPLDETLTTWRSRASAPAAWHFHWREDGRRAGAAARNHFLYFLRGRDILGSRSCRGEFEGSLPELARWINSHLKSPNGEVLMGGEIVDGQPKGKIKRRVRQTVAQAIAQFAKASRHLALRDRPRPAEPVHGRADRPIRARGAARSCRIWRSGTRSRAT